jgi:hypothetical protein
VKACVTIKCSWMQVEESDLEACGTTKWLDASGGGV